MDTFEIKQSKTKLLFLSFWAIFFHGKTNEIRSLDQRDNSASHTKTSVEGKNNNNKMENTGTFKKIILVFTGQIS